MNDHVAQHAGEQSIGMPRGSTLRIEDGAGALVQVREGELWLTEEGSPQDHVLRAGDRYLVTREGATLAHAFRHCEVSVSPSAGGVTARQILLLKAGARGHAVLYQHSGSRFESALRGLQGLRAAWQAFSGRMGAMS
jgi:hypothetical protein